MEKEIGAIAFTFTVELPTIDNEFMASMLILLYAIVHESYPIPEGL